MSKRPDSLYRAYRNEQKVGTVRPWSFRSLRLSSWTSRFVPVLRFSVRVMIRLRTVTAIGFSRELPTKVTLARRAERIASLAYGRRRCGCLQTWVRRLTWQYLRQRARLFDTRRSSCGSTLWHHLPTNRENWRLRLSYTNKVHNLRILSAHPTRSIHHRVFTVQDW